eukprot:CAMPEP_0114331298 /NCGR_PEP_ID=MMETSP0101-20121206/2313_1 /TAXON_ID=38822 ORGANISM="Pteridomonas danica, Strain PT" /NCGR_SAMPLE_ID=MMETSP0101 /ASSEMBLY_ACC=CAM_ASM_000211 /LENGTH=1158 /DNA_ID=CAMNT_0001461573 /DNA_START=37 /DNA_END=3517 /DNA_ORIENTATION=-
MKDARPGRVASNSARGRGRGGRVARRPLGAEEDETSTSRPRPRRPSLTSGDSSDEIVKDKEDSTVITKKTTRTRPSSGGPPLNRRMSGSSVPPRLRDTSGGGVLANNSSGSFNRKKSFENGNQSLGIQMKSIANQIFPYEKDKEYEDLICEDLSNDSEKNSTLIKDLQLALDESLQSRKEFIESCTVLTVVERRLVMESSESQGLISQYMEQIDELTANVQSLKLGTTTAVNAVEKRWRARLDEEMEKCRKSDEELRSRLALKEDEAGQLLYATLANERKISDLSTKATTASVSQLAESNSLKSRDMELDRLRSEVSRLTGVLEEKSNEVSKAMVTFAEMQRMGVEREGEVKAKLCNAEAKIEELNASLAEEKNSVFAVRQELMMSVSEASSLQNKLDDMKRQTNGVGGGGNNNNDYSSITQMNELMAKLAVETSLKERAEQREELERSERIATNAQRIAVEESKTKALEEAREGFAKRERKLTNEITEFNDRIESLSFSMKEFKDSNERLEAEKRILTRNLERMKVSHHHDGGGGGFDESDDDTSTQSDYASPAQRRREMSKAARNKDSKNHKDETRRGLWARMRNKKDDKPVEIYKKQNARRSSHQPAEQQPRRNNNASHRRQYHSDDDHNDNDSDDHSDGVFDEDELGAQLAASESGFSENDNDTQTKSSNQPELSKAKSVKEVDNTALLAAQAQLAQQAEAAVSQAQEMAELAGTNEELKSRVSELEKENQDLKDLLEKTKKDCAATLVELETKVREGETKRRKMHNLIQELRGNVRVFARVRPFLPNDKIKEANPKPWLVVRGDGVGLDVMGSTPTAKGSVMDEYPVYSFEYDKAFHPSQGQDAVFEEVSEFVQSALDGYNVCLFSYGQTGSGKTHTMQGIGAGDMRGIIPRAVQQVAEYKLKLEEQGWEYSMQVSFVEIYCEKIRDLLKKSSNGTKKSVGGSSSMGGSNDSGEHKILRNDYGANEITGVNMVSVDPADEEAMAQLMEIASLARATKKTDMNETSSRSHSVFTLHLKAINKKLNAHIAGQLNLCDLAGSERVDRSGAKGVTLTEAKNINKSLAALAHVFESLSKQAAHVPFRDSTLTYLLEPSLSGNGKTLMIINLSPTEMSVNESVSTLRFGAKVNKVELGKPKRQIGSGKSKEKDSKSSSK